ncbi:MAG: hypothetical protein E7378_00495 [Clostridiales bacterium]|nr:hypothetical protein [Clostridiales bacterium]
MLEGNSALAFEQDDPATDNTIEVAAQLEVNIVKGESKEVLIYAPAALVEDFNVSVTPKEFNGNNDDFFAYRVYGNEVGTKEYIISTKNGYSIKLTAHTIQETTEAQIDLASGVQYTAGIGEYKYSSSGDIINLSLQLGYSVGLNVILNENANLHALTYSFYEPNDAAYLGVYDKDNLDGLKDVESGNYDIGAVTYSSLSTILNTQNLKKENLITGLKEGVLILCVQIYGQTVLADGTIGADEPIIKYIFIEIYNPVKTLSIEATHVELRAKEDLIDSEASKELYTVELDAKALSNGGADATYGKIYINGGKINNNTGLCTVEVGQSFKVVYDYNTNKITITAQKYLAPYNITLFAGDFVYFTDTINMANLKKEFISVRLTISMAQTVQMEKIRVSNLDEVEDNNTKVDTYETLFLDTLKSDILTYKIFTEVLPAATFNKDLEFDYVSTSTNAQAIVTIDNSGLITVVGKNGGTGYITIKPKFSTQPVNMVKIPVVISDGKTRETAYKISSLDDIVDSTKHYVLTVPTTYVLDDKTLFEGKTFTGGLYGCETSGGARATIILKGKSLFDKLGANAYVEDLYICGDVTGAGFVATENAGTIKNVEVSTYIKNGVYVPSLLIAINKDGITSVGGIVGVNAGIIENCTFAGSILIEDTNANVSKLGAIAGEGSATNCVFVQAKFLRVAETIDRLVADGENYINGFIYTGSKLENKEGIAEAIYSAYPFDGNVNIKTDADKKYSLSIDEDKKHGIVFYYKAENPQNQTKIDDYNKIKITDLLNATTFEEEDLRVLAVNKDGTICNFIEVLNDSINIKGVGEFKLIISSKFDYTTSYEINMLSMYYFDKLTLQQYGQEISAGTTISIVDGKNSIIQSTEGNTTEGITLVSNNFEVLFTLENGGVAVDNNFISNNRVGVHTISINNNWDDSWTAGLTVSTKIKTPFATSFNKILNEHKLGENPASFKIIKRNGTTQITPSITSGEIEPQDYFSFDVVLTSDVEEDQIVASNIKIYNSKNYLMNDDDVFDIYVQTIEAGKQYKIYVGLYDSQKANTAYVNQTYRIVVQASNGGTVYECLTNVNMTIVPQTLASINTTLYRATRVVNGVLVDNTKQEPTSVLLPSDFGIFEIDLFPSFATYDYVEIVATSNTMATLSFRLQESTSETIFNDTTTSGSYDSLINKNGIKIYNNASSSTDQNVGRYFVKLFANSTYDQDTIFTITTTAYFANEALGAKAVFTLYVRMPEVPQVSIDGKTKHYTTPTETVEANVFVSNDQTNLSITLEANDQKSLSNVECFYEEVDSTQTNYKQYKVTVKFGEGYALDSSNSSSFKIMVESQKIITGQVVTVKGYVDVYVVDFILNEDSVVIYDAPANIFSITSLKRRELKLQINPEKIQGLEDAISLFASQYYYVNDYSNFNVWSSEQNQYNLQNDAEAYAPQIILAQSLSYVNGNYTLPILKTDGTFGDYNVADYQEFSKYVIFEYEDGKLYVKGGDYVGDVQMLLEIKYQMPDFRIFTYEYRFTLSNKIFYTEDMPKEIATNEDFLALKEETTAEDYILTNDINLYEYTAFENTDMIKSLDGNNYTINIHSYQKIEDGAANYALFNKISSLTTIKNVTINLYYLTTIDIGENVTSTNVAGLAINNSGIVYNTEVITYKSINSQSATSNTYGLKVNQDIDATVAGFVVDNQGSITNSRVGGDQKLITKLSYKTVTRTIQIGETTENVELVELDKVDQYYQDLTMFSILASGTISAFCQTNSGTISSSFAKNIEIVNNYNREETKATAGFVNTNNGKITMSYVQGAYGSSSNVRAEYGGIVSSGISAGFVYENNRIITDSYSNIKLTNTKQQTSRIGAGFVYHNAETAKIERCFSYSIIVTNNVTQSNFAGIKDFGGYNNEGTINHSYYYAGVEDSGTSIETSLNTGINKITNPTNKDEYYGFSFEGLKNFGTWQMSLTRGAILVSAEDITHSVRAKYEQIQGAEKVTIFDYCEGFELGSKYNPIIIRDAQEFNAVFTSSTSLAISDNILKEKQTIIGAYRLTNDIDLLELVPEDVEEGEATLNLQTTQMTLSGVEANTTGRNGSLEGNGLTIKNLAITSSLINSENFGMFKTLESGAKISNLTIEVAEGGVVSKQTICVGTIAGSIIDSTAYNIAIKGVSTQNGSSNIIGQNIVGGAFGRVVGESYVANISIESLSVIASYTAKNELSSSEAQYKNNNNYIRNLQKQEEGSTHYVDSALTYKNRSLAGGVAGVVDIYTQEMINADDYYAETGDTILDISVQSLSILGNFSVAAMTAGGLIGYVGEYVNAKDLLVTLQRQYNTQKIIAYNCYAGGIAGYSKGYLSQARIEHESAWQKEIESNIRAYYTGSEADRDQMDAAGLRGLNTLFESEYDPLAIGGIIGFACAGKLSIAYSKVNVLNQRAKYLGGVFGFVASATEDKRLYVNEVYTISDVYGESATKIGGFIGLKQTASCTISKANALNYWGYDAYEKFSVVDQTVIYAFAHSPAVPAGTPADVVDVKVEYIDEIEFDGGKKDVGGESGINYAQYKGVQDDNGALMDTNFRENGWYENNNWSRDINEEYPHILFTNPNMDRTIKSIADFHKFIEDGHNPNVTFYVIDMVDCNGWNLTLNAMRAQIIGTKSEYGFKNLSVPLFTSVHNKISNMTFDNCSAPIAQTAILATFENLIYKDCSHSTGKDGNLGVVVHKVEHQAVFNGISFTKTERNSLTASNVNAGYLFGYSSGSVSINDIRFDEATMSAEITQYGEKSIGLLYGQSTGSATIANVDVDNSGLSGVSISNDEANVNVGYLVGSSATLDIVYDTISITDPIYTFDDEPLEANQLTVGGIVGSVSAKLTISIGDTTATTSSQFIATVEDFNIDASASKTLIAGGVVGWVKEISVANTNIIVGYAEEQEDKTHYADYTYTLAEKNNYIGGVAGQAEKITTRDEKIIAFYGDIIIVGGNAESMNIGGIVGYLPNKSEISNVYYEGTISFEHASTSTENIAIQIQNANIGGIIGKTNNSITLTNALASGEILLAKDGDNVIFDTGNAGGVIGLCDGSTTLKNIYAVTTIFNKISSNNLKLNSIDAIINIVNGKTPTFSKAEDDTGAETANSSVIFSSGINLEPTKHHLIAENKALIDNISTTHPELSTFVGNAKGLITSAGATGTKFAPTSTESCNFDDAKQAFECKSDDIRKLYVSLPKEVEHAVILKNAFLISTQEVHYSTITPIHEIDTDSVVSNVNVAVYIDIQQESNTTNFADHNKAGFANENAGIIYGCSVRETLNKYYNETKQTLFHGYINNGAPASGFVYTNTGRIFASNANIKIAVNNQSVSAFVFENSGSIEYCYVSGEAEAKFLGTNTLDEYKADTTKTIPNVYLFTAGDSPVDSCYTIFKCSYAKDTMPSSGCLYEADACEWGTSTTKLYGNAPQGADEEDWNYKGYYDCDINYNYNYPTISAGMFATMTSLKRDTRVCYDGAKYVKYVAESPANRYYQIPNITVFSDIDNKIVDSRTVNTYGTDTDAGEFVMISDLDLNYTKTSPNNKANISALTGLILDGNYHTINNIFLKDQSMFAELTSSAVRNIIFNNIVLDNSTGLIKTISDSATTLNNLKITGNVQLKSMPEATYTTSEIDDNIDGDFISISDNTIGILVGSNAGIITKCENFANIVSYEINSQTNTIVNYQNTKNFAVGGLVGTNTGTIQESNFGGSVDIRESDVNNGAFGGIAAVNNSTISKCQITNPNNFINVLLEEDYDNANHATRAQIFSGQTGIYVATKNVATVGGIVSYLQDGTISDLVTYQSNTNQYGIVVGDQTLQKITYVGGIVGFMYDGTVLDAANRMNIKGLARWRFVKDNGTPEDYEYFISGYDSTPISASYNYDSISNMVVVSKPMIYTAYTGGIAGYGLNSAAEDGTNPENTSNRLANYGTITGGQLDKSRPFMALDYVSNPSEKDLRQKLDDYEKFTFKDALKGIFFGGAGAVVEWTQYCVRVKRHKEAAGVVFVKPYFVYGASTNSFDRNMAKIIPEIIASNFGSAFGNNINTPNGRAYTSINFSYYKFANTLNNWFGREELDDGKAPVTEVKWTSSTVDASTKPILTAADSIDSDTDYKRYDDICVTLEGSNLNVFVTAGEDKKYDTIYSPSNKPNWKSKDGVAWADDEESKLIPGFAAPKAIERGVTEEHIRTVDDNYCYTVHNTEDWRNIVYTINNWNTSDSDYNKIKSMTIDIQPQNGATIQVGSSVLNEFNGTIQATNSATLLSVNYKSSTIPDYTTSVGLIRKTSGCTIKNIAIDDINISAIENEGTNVGLLIGEASENVIIENVSINSGDRNINNVDTSKINNFGGLIGLNNGEATITNANVSLNITGYKKDITSASSAFGGLIGTNGNKATITNASVYGIVELATNFNKVGGFVGKNNKTLIASGTSNITLKIASVDDVAVGGIVGENVATDGNITISSINIAQNANIISADVYQPGENAYAGGVAGVNNGTLTINQNVTIGSESASYIIAGYNKVLLDNMTFEFASQASAGKLVGNGNDATTTGAIVVKNNVTIKSIMADLYKFTYSDGTKYYQTQTPADEIEYSDLSALANNTYGISCDDEGKQLKYNHEEITGGTTTTQTVYNLVKVEGTADEGVTVPEDTFYFLSSKESEKDIITVYTDFDNTTGALINKVATIKENETICEDGTGYTSFTLGSEITYTYNGTPYKLTMPEDGGEKITNWHTSQETITTEAPVETKMQSLQYSIEDKTIVPKGIQHAGEVVFEKTITTKYKNTNKFKGADDVTHYLNNIDVGYQLKVRIVKQDVYISGENAFALQVLQLNDYTKSIIKHEGEIKYDEVIYAPESITPRELLNTKITLNQAKTITLDSLLKESFEGYNIINEEEKHVLMYSPAGITFTISGATLKMFERYDIICSDPYSGLNGDHADVEIFELDLLSLTQTISLDKDDEGEDTNIGSVVCGSEWNVELYKDGTLEDLNGDDVDGSAISKAFTQDTTTVAGVPVVYLGDKIVFATKEYNYGLYTNTFDYAGDSYLMVSLVNKQASGYLIEEYVYLYDATESKLYPCGSISYNSTSANIARTRNHNLFPSVLTGITKMSYDITAPGVAITSLSYDYVHYETTIRFDVWENKAYYQYTVTTKQFTATGTINNAGAINQDDPIQTSTSSETPVIVPYSNNSADGFLTATNTGITPRTYSKDNDFENLPVSITELDDATQYVVYSKGTDILGYKVTLTTEGNGSITRSYYLKDETYVEYASGFGEFHIYSGYNVNALPQE